MVEGRRRTAALSCQTPKSPPYPHAPISHRLAGKHVVFGGGLSRRASSHIEMSQEEVTLQLNFEVSLVGFYDSGPQVSGCVAIKNRELWEGMWL